MDPFFAIIEPSGGSSFLAKVSPITPPSSGQPPHPEFPIAGGPGLPDKPGYPDHPSHFPLPPGPGTPPDGGGGQPPADVSTGWEFRSDGWYRVTGPFDKPRPMPGLGEPGKWEFHSDGVYYVQGPYDKPKPPGLLPPEEPPVQPPPDVNYGWKYKDDGWYFYVGPLDKPQPIPPGK